MDKWNFSQFYEDYGDVEFEVGEDEEGIPVNLKLKEYFQYMIFNQDDSPFYLFQRSLQKNPEMKKLLEDYEIPKYFKQDFQQLIDIERRPDYNWLLIGPRRSGSYIHYDPFSMSAWNTSLYGHKKWIFIEPGCDRNIAEAFDFRTEENQYNFDAINHIINLYPKLLEEGFVKKKYEFIQKRGDTIFLPSRWWHVVLNIDDTIAITQNFTNEGNFENVWKRFRRTKKRSACNWLRNMKEKDNGLYEKAVKINEEDGFKMYDYYMMKKQPWPLSPSSSQTESSEDLSDYEYDYGKN